MTYVDVGVLCKLFRKERLAWILSMKLIDFLEKFLLNARIVRDREQHECGRGGRRISTSAHHQVQILANLERRQYLSGFRIL